MLQNWFRIFRWQRREREWIGPVWHHQIGRTLPGLVGGESHFAVSDPLGEVEALQVAPVGYANDISALEREGADHFVNCGPTELVPFGLLLQPHGGVAVTPNLGHPVRDHRRLWVLEIEREQSLSDTEERLFQLWLDGDEAEPSLPGVKPANTAEAGLKHSGLETHTWERTEAAGDGRDRGDPGGVISRDIERTVIRIEAPENADELRVLDRGRELTGSDGLTK